MDGATGPRPVVIGLGNALRGDDAIGPEVVRRLRAGLAPAGTLACTAASPIDALDVWSGAPLAVVVDAMVSGAEPGTVVRLEGDALEGVEPAGYAASAHGLGLGETLALGRALDRMPDRLVAFAVEARSFEHGLPLSADAAAAVEAVVNQIVEELRAVGCGAGASPEAAM